MPFVDDLNDRYFDGALSQEVMRLLHPINDHRLEVQRFVERMFRQLKTRCLPAADFAENLAWATGSILPGVLPEAWGAVPPVTQKGRHAAIDEYLARNSWREMRDGDCLLDIGCGFPPVTVVDTAERFPSVRVVGADPSFGEYLIREANGDYAVFDRDGNLLYFQPGRSSASAWAVLYRDPARTRARFLAHLRNLHVGEIEGRRGRIIGDDVELVRNPLDEYEGSNVSFVRRGMFAEDLYGFSVIRCFNVLYYYDDAFRQAALRWFASVAIDGGLIVTGANWSASSYARYSVHRREGGATVPLEFAFSIENVRPLHFSSMFALDDNDHDICLMSSLIATLRSDEDFRSNFDKRIDEIQAELGICPRNSDGYLGRAPKQFKKTTRAGPEAIGLALVREGFVDWAVDVLSRNGYRAWRNAIGHVAIDPASALSCKDAIGCHNG